MDNDTRRKIIRIAALKLLHDEVPGAPSGAVGPPSKWWELAEQVIDAIDPYFREAYDDV